MSTEPLVVSLDHEGTVGTDFNNSPEIEGTIQGQYESELPRVILAGVEEELCCVCHRCISLYTCYVRFLALPQFPPVLFSCLRFLNSADRTISR